MLFFLNSFTLLSCLSLSNTVSNISCKINEEELHSVFVPMHISAIHRMKKDLVMRAKRGLCHYKSFSCLTLYDSRTATLHLWFGAALNLIGTDRQTHHLYLLSWQADWGLRPVSKFCWVSYGMVGGWCTSTYCMQSGSGAHVAMDVVCAPSQAAGASCNCTKNWIRVLYDNRFQFSSASLMDVKPGSRVIEECPRRSRGQMDVATSICTRFVPYTTRLVKFIFPSNFINRTS